MHDISVSSRHKKPPPDLADLLPSWEVALAAERKSPKTIAVYIAGVRAFIRWCADADTDPVPARPTVQAFTVALLNAGAEPHTARARHQALRRFAAWLVAGGELDVDPLLAARR
jgi:site-specific recombinase XerC